MKHDSYLQVRSIACPPDQPIDLDCGANQQFPEGMKHTRFMGMIRFGFIFLASLLTTGSLKAQTTDPIPLHRIQGPITLDGLSNEPAWNSVEPFPMVQYEPHAGAPPSEKSEVLAAYDDHYLYFALRAFDSDPSGIRGNILYRDRYGSDDYFEVLLDTYNDNENAIIFTTSPAGIRRDTEIHNDASGGTFNWINQNFNTYWDAAARTTDEGWFAEIRVPFSSIRFQDVQGRVVMGISFHRIISRKVERSTFPAIEPNIRWSFLKPSRAQKIVLEGVYSRNPVYLTTYALGGFSQSTAWGPVHLDRIRDHELSREIGADLKYGLTNNFTLDLTVNTDFAQAEADDQQINLTRFSLFYPEKRQFFQERSGVFDFSTGGQSRLFHSRRIGLTDQGEAVRIYGGARGIGRIGNWDVGFLDMQTAESGNLPSENFGVLRLRRRILNEFTTVGGMATSRIGLDGNVSVSYGLDGVFRLHGDDYLYFQWAQTLDDRTDNLGKLGSLDAGLLNILVERRRANGFGYTSGGTWSGAYYNPALGFVQRTDFTYLDQQFSYHWQPAPPSKFIRHSVYASGNVFIRNEDRTVESLEIGPEYLFFARSGAGGGGEFKLLYEAFRDTFYLSQNVFVPSGEYTFYQGVLNYQMSQTALRQYSVTGTLGSFYDGWRGSISVSPTWYVSPHLELGGQYVFNHIGFSDRNQTFNGHIARLRIGTALNTKLSTNAFVQYNSSIRSFSANVRFRYNFREGTDLWIVLNTDDWINMRPITPQADMQTVIVKYTHTFAM